MEPIGAAASLLTLIEATAVIGKAAVKLHHDLRDAPQDIARIAERILVARSRLEAQLRYHKEHCSVSERDGVKLVNYQGLAALEMSLQNASSCLEELNGAHTLRSQKLTKSQCLRWILRERRPVLKLMQHLQDVEDGLSKLQITISLSVFSSTCVPVTPLLTSLRSISAASYSAIKDVAVQQSAFLDEVRRKKNFEMALPETEPQTGNQSIVASASWDYSLSTCHEDRYLTAKPKVWGRLANNENSWTLSSFVLTNTHWNLLSSAYSVTSLLRLPYFFSDRAISIQAQLQCFQLSWPSISHSVTLKNIVSQNLRFMRACRAGTVGEVRKLAMSRQGSPTDIDEFGTPALHVRTGHQVPCGPLIKFLECYQKWVP